jgi:hypothetical protein
MEMEHGMGYVLWLLIIFEVCDAKLLFTQS